MTGGGNLDPTLDPTLAQTAGSSHRADPGGGFRPYRAGDTIGRYTIGATLGEGGFGVVYEARQSEPVRRSVALKVIKPGMDSRAVVARFEAERQALALMDHPCVAKVLDGGLTDRGLPYFAMELVDGRPIDAFCDAERLSVEERLRLVQRVCAAVQHAHTKGVIHRDLKPANILVARVDDEPTPKVIDFGIAKAVEEPLTADAAFTVQGQMIGTPGYMCPEQASAGTAALDTRADVYALGVVLYELLTGEMPFPSEAMRGATIDEIRRLIREVDPPKPSTRLATLAAGAGQVAAARRTEPRSLSSTLKSDLDWVVMRCLEKDPDRRYDTPDALSQELGRYLNSEPVLAGPPSVSYRVAKFVRRNRVGVAAGSAIALALLLATGVSIAFAIEAGRERDRAEELLGQRDEALDAERERAEELRRVADFQSLQLASIDPNAFGETLREAVLAGAPEGVGTDLRGVNFTDAGLDALRAHVFDPTRAAIDEGFAEQPLVRAQLLQTLAVTLSELGVPGESLEPQGVAVGLIENNLGAEHPEAVTARRSLAAFRFAMGETGEEIERAIRASYEDKRERLGDDDPETLAALIDIGGYLEAVGRFGEALELQTRALAALRRTAGDDDPGTITGIAGVANTLVAMGRYDEAVPLAREAMERSRRVLGAEHPDTLAMIITLAYLVEAEGRAEEAGELFGEALAITRRVRGERHPETAMALNNYAYALDALGRHQESEQTYREAIASLSAVLGDDHPEVNTAKSNLGVLLYRVGLLDEAAEIVADVHTARVRTLGAEHPNTLSTLNNLAVINEARGEATLAIEQLRGVLTASRRVVGDGHPDTLNTMNHLAGMLRKAGAFDEADRIGREAVERSRGTYGETHWRVGDFMSHHADTLLARGDRGAAIERYIAAHALMSEGLGKDNDRVAGLRSTIARLYRAMHDEDPSQGFDELAAAWLDGLPTGPNH